VNRRLLKSKVWVDPRYGSVQRTNETVSIAPPKVPDPPSRPRASTTTSIPATAPAP
jgi:hypothetical protein